MNGKYQIITFYEFKDMEAVAELSAIKESLRSIMSDLSLRGTVILASEGFNSTVGGLPENVGRFVEEAEALLKTKLVYRSSFHDELPFKRIKIKIKKEIVTLRKDVDLSLGRGTHVDAKGWNELLADPETLVLDTRNDYEFRTGTFENAVNPCTEKFNDLPAFVEKNLDPASHKKIAMFCTGGIRCEKFAPYVKGLGFKNVYQLEGGILKYLKDVNPEDSLWKGECFVFDERISVSESLEKGSLDDFSQANGK